MTDPPEQRRSSRAAVQAWASTVESDENENGPQQKRKASLTGGTASAPLEEDHVFAKVNSLKNEKKTGGKTERQLSRFQTMFQMCDAYTPRDARKLREHFVLKPWFNMFVGFAIAANAMVIGVEVDYGKGMLTVSARWPFFLAEVGFGLLFAGEMLARQHAYGWLYFTDPWNVMDYHLVVLGFVDTAVSLIFADKASDLKMLTVLRMIRMLRIVRQVRLLHLFRELWMIVKGFFDTLPTLFWVAMLLSIISFCVAIYMSVVVAQDDNCVWEWRFCRTYTGTIPKGMLTLLQVITLENWATNVARPISKVSPIMPFVLIFVITVCTFGALNVIVGVIVERTMMVASENDEKVYRVIEECEKQVMYSMAAEFTKFDSDRDGGLDFNEFHTAIHTKVFRQKLALIDVAVEDCEELFLLMDVDRSGSISAEEFLIGIQRIKGTAKGKDMIQLIAFVRGCVLRVTKLFERVERMIEKADLVLERLDEMFGLTEQELHEREYALSRQRELKRKINDKHRVLRHLDRQRERSKVPELKTKTDDNWVKIGVQSSVHSIL